MCDGNPPQAFSAYNRKARKEHKCCECHKTIQPGETYSYASGIWDGEPKSYKSCRGCVGIERHYMDIHECHPPFGMLAEYIREDLYGGFDIHAWIADSGCEHDAMMNLMGGQNAR